MLTPESECGLWAEEVAKYKSVRRGPYSQSPDGWTGALSQPRRAQTVTIVVLLVVCHAVGALSNAEVPGLGALLFAFAHRHFRAFGLC